MVIEQINKDIPTFANCIKTGNPYKPLLIKLKLVWNCNLRCQMCNHWRRKDSSLNYEFFLNVIDELADLGCKRIHLTGGEPLLYSKIHKILKRIKKNGIKASMTTNGTLINEEKAELLVKSGLKKVNISIDSPDEEIHDKIRGVKGAFKKTCDGFVILRRLMPQRSIYINMVVSPENYKTISALPKFAREINASAINLMPLIVHTPEVNCFSKKQLLEYNSEVVPKLLEESEKYGFAVNEKDIYIFGITDNSLNEFICGKYSADYYSTHKCYALWTHALIDHLGRVSACCRMTDNPVIGNLQENSFGKIWNGDTYKKLRKSEHLPIVDICKQCAMFKRKNQIIDSLLC
jgi:radical SAM protein with 4Fe4S-binding SPASM domain